MGHLYPLSNNFCPIISVFKLSLLIFQLIMQVAPPLTNLIYTHTMISCIQYLRILFQCLLRRRFFNVLIFQFKLYRLIFQPIMQVVPSLEQTLFTNTKRLYAFKYPGILLSSFGEFKLFKGLY